MNNNWEGWAAHQGMLQDGQLWENNNDMVFQVHKMGEESYRVVMFSSHKDELHYVATVLYDCTDKLMHLLDSMDMAPTSKILTIRRR